MNSLKKWIRDIFGFSGNEINGFLILIPLMVILIFSEPIYSSFIAHTERNDDQDKIVLDSLLSLLKNDQPAPTQPGSQRFHSFPFNPNTAPLDTLLKLGFSETSANRIAAYRAKGGSFRIKSDLLKIYGLDSTLYKQLYGNILLPSLRKQRKQETAYRSQFTRKGTLKTKGEKPSFDLNVADTLLLKTVYGIGSKLASRIIKFRNGLGGFIQSEQLKEVYGLDSMVVNRLTKMSFIAAGFTPVKLNINTASEEQLSAHPYIRYKTARVLITYRFQHGDFKEVHDIKKLQVITQEEVEKILPYISVSN
ncbi:MAG: helix-hairpin-helix domain-containing protein [Cyclobacteriaceae bacterium]